MSKPKSLTTHQIAALRRAAANRRGMVSSGHRFASPDETLRALARRGLLEFVGGGGPYYDRHLTFRITAAGRAWVEANPAPPEDDAPVA